MMFVGVSSAAMLNMNTSMSLLALAEQHLRIGLNAGVDSTSLREWFKDQTLIALQSEQRARNAKVDLAAIRANRQLTLVQSAVRQAVEGATNIEYDAELEDIIVTFEQAPTQRFASYE